MRAIVQRVSSANVISNGVRTGRISLGFVVLLGIEHNDTKDDAIWLADKIRQMRIFSDASEKMNLSLSDINGEILLVSQFTLHANTKRVTDPLLFAQQNPKSLFHFMSISNHI